MLSGSRKIWAMAMILLKEEDFGYLLDLRSRFRCSLLRSCPLMSIVLPLLMAVSTSVSGGRAAVWSALPLMALLTLFNGHDGDTVVLGLIP